MKHFFAIFLFVLTSLSLSASHVHLSLTGVASGTHFYYCSTSVDSIIVHKPSIAPSGAVQWNHSGYPAIVSDSVIVTQSMQGHWTCQYSPVDIIEFYVNFTSIAPTQPWTATDTTKCTESLILLNAQPNAQPDFTYLWGDSTTNRYVNVITPGTYTVTITGACGVVSDSIEIINYPVPTPNLGSDIVTCDGNTVTLDPGSFDGYAWSTSASTQTIDVTTDGTYSVDVMDTNGCHGSDTVDVTFLFPPTPEIKVVTIETDPVSPLYGNNKPTWDTDLMNVDSVIIWRETTSNAYDLEVGKVPYSTGAFTDTVSSKLRAWGYKIQFQDTCGNLSAKSDYHKTCKISLNVNPGGEFTANWSPYQIEDSTKSVTIPRYDIYTGEMLNALSYLTFVPGDQYVYGPFAFTDSLVVVAAVITTPAKAEITAFSYPITEADVASVGEETLLPFDLYPNPSSGEFTVIGEGTLNIHNIIGECILTDEIRGTTNYNLSAGVYVVTINNKNAIYTKKVIIQ